MEPKKSAPLKPVNHMVPVYTAIAVVAFFFVINDLLDWINGGGFLSIVASVRAVAVKAPVVDPDGGGLRIIFVGSFAIIAAVVGWFCKTDLSKRWTQFVFLFWIILGGTIVDMIFGQALINHYMIEHGYAHCASRDHVVGHGKSRVWFKDYVLNEGDCPIAAPAQ